MCALFHSFGLRVSLTYTVKTNTHTRTNVHNVPDVQLFSVFINLLRVVSFLFFLRIARHILLLLFVPSFPFSWSLFPPPSSRFMLNLLLRLPPNAIHPPPLPLCLQEFVSHYRSLPHPNQPNHPAWCHSFSTVLSHYLPRHQRSRPIWDIKTLPLG